MRAGIVYIKVPIEAIFYEKTDDDVTFLKESIKMYGLLQPVGIKAKKDGYKLLFGKKRIKACKELGHKYIHSVLISVREDEEKYLNFIENVHRSNDDFLYSALNTFKGTDLKEHLCLSPENMNYIEALYPLDEFARKKFSKKTIPFIPDAKGDSKYFLRMCTVIDNVPLTAKEKIRLSYLTDKRIFLNEIEKIIDLMRLYGHNDTFIEDNDKIIIKKNAS